MEYDNEDEEQQSPSGVNQLELLRSYASYVGRAVKKRRLILALFFVVIAGITAGLVSVLPPTYHCEMKLTAIRNQVFEDEARGNMLAGAREIVMRHESLVALVKRADLVKRWEQDRAPVLRLKDQIMARLAGGEASEADKTNALVYSLGQRLGIQTDDITLTISVDWPAAETAAKIVDATQQIFLEARHGEEISTIQERISILDQHATSLRTEIDSIAEQLEHLRQDKLAQADKALNNGAAASTAGAAIAAPRRPRPSGPVVDEELTRLKEELEQKKKAIADLEADRSRRLVEAQGRLEEMRIKFTPVHPAALAAEHTIASLSHESEQVAGLRETVAHLESSIRERAGVSVGGGGGGGGSGGGAQTPKADVLPSEIMRLLDSGTGIDPTVSAHLGSTVNEYTQLQESIRSRRLALDNAQAAFNHRYKILIPVEVPAKPNKSKGPFILIGGWAFGLLFVLAYAVIAELRTGVVIERWQVHQMQLPILAELQFPPSNPHE